MEPFSASVELTWADQMDWLKTTSASSLKAWLAMSVFGTLVIWAVHVFQSGVDLTYMGLTAVFMIIMTVTLGFIANFLLVALGYSRMNDQQKSCVYSFNETGFSVRDASGNQVAFQWDQVKRAKLDTTGFSFLTRHMGLRWCPRRAFSQEQTEALSAFLRDQSFEFRT